MPAYFIGTSGWHYEHWRNNFYPSDLARAKWLEFYASHFNAVELNNSFYRLPSEKAFATWYRSSPPGFVFAVKVSRFITHIKRLRDTNEPLQNFLTRANFLQEKLGPLLYQLPPGMKRNEHVLESFLQTLPPGYQHVFEFRNESWLSSEIIALLRRHNVALCVFDMPGFTCPAVVTADFAYFRFHGSKGLYWSCYSDDELHDWATKIAEAVRDLKIVYIFFNNDAEAYAVCNALTLARFLGLEDGLASRPLV